MRGGGESLHRHYLRPNTADAFLATHDQRQRVVVLAPKSEAYGIPRVGEGQGVVYQPVFSS